MTENQNKASRLREIADFLSTVLVALVVMIAVILIGSRIIGIHLFNVESGSMSPAYPVDSLVIVKETEPDEIVEGDVITYVMNEAGMLVTHRVVSIDTANQTFTTKGDANNVEDAMPVLWGNMVGKVIFGIPGIGPAIAAMTAEENRKIMIGIIAGLLLLSFVWDFSKKKKRVK